MAYGAGRVRLKSRVSNERARERATREADLAAAEGGRESQSSKEQGWGLGLSILGGALLGPMGIPLGKAAGLWGADLADKEAEQQFVSEDVGKYDAAEKYELADINRDLRAADRSENWQHVTDIGKSAALAYTLGGGKVGDASNFSLTKFGGADAKTGMGLFNIGGGGKEGSLWSRWLG